MKSALDGVRRSETAEDTPGPYCGILMSGLSNVTGYPGEAPIDTGAFYGDPTGGLFGAAAVSTTLWHRMRTGEGQQIHLVQREATAAGCESRKVLTLWRVRRKVAHLAESPGLWNRCR